MAAATYTAAEVAEMLGITTYALYQSVRRGTCPVEPFRMGKKMLWPKAAVDRLLCLSSD